MQICGRSTVITVVDGNGETFANGDGVIDERRLQVSTPFSFVFVNLRE
jgi:hypothetical protein